MNIWLAKIGEPVPVNNDSGARLLRTGYFARFLVDQGHRVTWWTSTFDHTSKKHWFDRDTLLRLSDGLDVMMIRSPGYATNTSPARIVDHSLIGRKFAALSRNFMPPDVIVAPLPTIRLCRSCVDYGRRHDIPVVVDIRDLWPDVMVSASPTGLRGAVRLGLSYLFYETRQALRRCTGIIGISEAYLAWGLHRAGRPRGPNDVVFPLGYSRPVLDDGKLAAAGAELTARGVSTGKTICWFVGMFGRTYDLYTVIEAARLLAAQGLSDIQFVLSGNGSNYQQLVSLAAGLDNVVFTGWLDKTQIGYMLRQADIGLMAYASGAPQGLPNKLFEYLSAGIPIVSSLRGETELLLDCHQCGLTYEAKNAGALADLLRQLARDGDRRQEMGRRGRQLYDDNFRAETICQNMAAYLERLVR